MFDFIKTISKFVKLKLEEDSLNLEHNVQKKLFETIESIEDGSSRVTTWSLSIIGGSLVVFMNGEYIQPQEELFKYTYLIFIIGWILLAISIFFSKQITGQKMAATLNINDTKNLKQILINVNRRYARQLQYFNWALVLFGLWLILYFIWRLFGEQLKCLNH